MTRFPAATRQDHQKFCGTEGWQRVRNVRGKTGAHHLPYEFTLPDGRVLRTRISHPPDRSTYGTALWGHILRDQLEVTEDTLWACVRDGVQPDRGQPQQPEAAIPASLVHQLVVRFRVPEEEVAAMTKQQAIDRLSTLWSQSDR